MSPMLKPRHASVQFADPTAPSGKEVSRGDFLKQCRQSALARFRAQAPAWLSCRTIEHPVPALPGTTESTGMIVAHVSPTVCKAWESTLVGTSMERRAQLEAQVHLAMQDLADQDMHGYLALTEAQCDLFGPDLEQLTTESLDRTSFSRLARKPDPQWEGTLVERVRPPYLVLTVSIDFAEPEPEPRRRPPRPFTPGDPMSGFDPADAGA